MQISQNAQDAGGVVVEDAQTPTVTTPVPATEPTESGLAAESTPIVEIGGGNESLPIDPTGWSLSFDPESALALIDKGGPVVAILLLMSVLAVAVIFLKVFQFIATRVGHSARTEAAQALWIEGRPDEAYRLVARSRTPSAVAFAHGIRGFANGVDERIIREDVERVALQQLAGLRSYLRVLESTVQIAPLLGLFGTVIGMISAFQALQSAGSDSDPAVLAGGIWVALLTTAVGLAVAIPVAFVNAWFEGRIEQERVNTEAALTSLFTRQATAIGKSPAVAGIASHVRAAE